MTRLIAPLLARGIGDSVHPVPYSVRMPGAALVCALFAVTGTAQPAPPTEMDALQPSAVPAAPVRERLADGRGRRVATMVYRLPDDLPPERRMTIAQRRWIGARIAALPAGRRSVTMRCAVPPSGGVPATSGCVAETGTGDGYEAMTQRLGFLLRPAMPALPLARASDLPRALRYRVRLDPADWPGAPPPGNGRAFDRAAAGPIVALLQNQMRDEFPDVALAAGVEALVMADCLVEEDRSVSCRTRSVEPAVARPYFAGSVDAIFPRGRLPDRLTDGTPTPGLTFRVPFRFVIGD